MIPDRESQDGPDLAAVVFFSFFVVFQKLCQFLGMEKLPGFPGCEHFHHHLVPVILPQPYADGNGKAQLFSAVSVLGDVTGYGFAENIFGSATCNLGVFGRPAARSKTSLSRNGTRTSRE